MIILSFSFHSSLSCNSIYGIHSSYYPFSLSIYLNNILLIIWLNLWYNHLFFNYSISTTYFLSIPIQSDFIGYLAIIFMPCFSWLSIFNWINDLYIESLFFITLTEQLSLISSIKVLIISEFMLFVACFWSLVNFRFVSNSFSLFFSFPLFFSYSFSIPFSNLCLLLFSSLPLQSAQIFIKIGFLNNAIESMAQSLSCGFLFVVLQLKEFIYSYFSISDSLIGSIFYFTTGLHGLHVILGTFLFFLILFFFQFTIFSSLFLFDLPVSINVPCFYHYYFNSASFTDYLYIISLFLISSLLFSVKSLFCNNRLTTSLIYLSGLFFLFNSLVFIEYSFSLFLASYYWHFVDWIWFCVFLILIYQSLPL